MATPPAPNRIALLEAGLACALALALAFAFARSSWWGPDDGAYLYVAQRILAGDILHRDIQDIHAGYVNFANAAALALFGDDVASLRWPLVLLTGLQSAVVYFIARPVAGRMTAVAAALAVSAMSFILFPNPTANWYALFFSILLGALLSNHTMLLPRKALLAGFLVGVVFLLRQPTGVFVAIAALLALLGEAAKSATASSRLIAGRALLALCFGILVIYFSRAANLSGFLIFGAGPLVVLVAGMASTNVGVQDAARIVARMAVGAVAALLPLLLYHLAHGSIGAWINDSFLAPARIREFPFFAAASYFNLPIASLALIPETGAPAVANVLFWLLLIAGPLLLAARLLQLRIARRTTPFEGFAVVALFYGIVSLHYEIPIYLFYSSGMTLAALALLHVGAARNAAIGAIALASMTSVALHAGQPAAKGLKGIAAGERAPLVALNLPGASIRSTPADHDFYARAVAVIQGCTTIDDRIFAFPTNAELHALSGRRSAYRFFSTGMGLVAEADVAATLALLESEERPALVIHHANDKYNSPLSDQLLPAIATHYGRVVSFGGFDFYAPSPMSVQCVTAASLGERDG